jgi:uncharacterized protein with HEPN domain
MKEEIKAWLHDILNCVNEIESYFEKHPKDFNYYLQNAMLRKATERNLEIIGEAMSRALKAEPSLPISDSRKIVDLRNKVIHGYDVVDDANIWSIVINHLPKLKVEIEKLLNE